MKCPTCGIPILEHPANRCLDIWVATKVMGWIRRTFKSDGVDYWHIPGAACELDTLPFSTDIAAAWQVVEKHQFYFSLYKSNDTYWMRSPFDKVLWKCRFFAPQAFEAEADTAPLAICRAALIAVMEATNDP